MCVYLDAPVYIWGVHVHCGVPYREGGSVCTWTPLYIYGASMYIVVCITGKGGDLSNSGVNSRCRKGVRHL